MATITPSLTQLTTADIFARLAPSIAFVEVASGSGSGVLIEGGYVLTNAHVVWPFEHVRVVFGDQSEHLKVPVAHLDPMAGLALLGPIQTTLSPLPLGNGEDLAVGSEVLLISYPGEPGKLPRPTLAKGILSLLLEWEPIQMTFILTEAITGAIQTANASGQSGGVLISRDGEIIGITSIAGSSGEGQGSLALSAKDILPRLRGLLAGEDVTGLGDRRIPRKDGQTSHTASLENPLAVQAYVVDVPEGTELKVEVESEHDASFIVVGSTGYLLAFADEGTSGLESASATTEVAGPHFVVIFREEGWGPGELEFQVTSNRQLIPVHDPDDGKTINLGQTLRGSIDYPGDSDVFLIDLEKGAIITMHLDSIAFDPLVGILATGSEFGELVKDDDSGGGLFGFSAELRFKATQAGTHLILVEDNFGEVAGGYILTVRPHRPHRPQAGRTGRTGRTGRDARHRANADADPSGSRYTCGADARVSRRHRGRLQPTVSGRVGGTNRPARRNGALHERAGRTIWYHRARPRRQRSRSDGFRRLYRGCHQSIWEYPEHPSSRGELLHDGAEPPGSGHHSHVWRLHDG